MACDVSPVAMFVPQVQDDVEAVRSQLMELRKEMDANKGAVTAMLFFHQKI